MLPDAAEIVSSYWVNFIAHGDPNGPGLPHWPSSSDQLLRLGAEPQARLTLPSERGS